MYLLMRTLPVYNDCDYMGVHVVTTSPTSTVNSDVLIGINVYNFAMSQNVVMATILGVHTFVSM